MKMYQLKDQVVLITGAAGGIGAEVVKLLVEEEVKHVAVLDIDSDAGIKLQNELNRKSGKNIVKYYLCDVTKEEVLLGIFKSVKDEHGYIDVVINNAGILNDSKNFYKKEIEINLTAVVTGTLKAIEDMRKDKGGRGGTVINISSTAGITQKPLIPIYYATKSAILQFSNCIGVRDLIDEETLKLQGEPAVLGFFKKEMDAHYSRTAVRVLAICFGPTDTAIFNKEKTGSFDPDYEDVMNKTYAGTRTQKPAFAAKGLVEAFKQGESGTTWLVDADKPAQDISTDVRSAYDIMGSKIAVVPD